MPSKRKSRSSQKRRKLLQFAVVVILVALGVSFYQDAEKQRVHEIEVHEQVTGSSGSSQYAATSLAPSGGCGYRRR